MQLLQIDVLSTPVAAGSAPTDTLLGLLVKGGWVMLPLLLFSILTVYALVERLIGLRRASKIPQPWLDSLYTSLQTGDLTGVKALCAEKPYAMAQIIQAGTDQLTRAPQKLPTVVEQAAQTTIYQLEKNLSLLGTIAGTAPMLGFLGTVLGMIQAFMTMAQSTQQVSPQLLSGGIYEALITTAAGLVVGLGAHLSYNYLLTRIQKATYRIEQAAHQFVTIAQNIPQGDIARAITTPLP